MASGPARSIPAERSQRSDAVVPLERSSRDDADLVLALQRRDSAAIAELFDRYGQLVRQMLIRALGTNHDVDDIVQESFIVVIRRIHTLEKPSALRSFVISVALRTAKNELRRRRVRRWVGLEEAAEPPLVPGHDPVTAERVRRVYAALERLDAGSRTLFVLRHVEGLELTELADAEGCSLATLKRRLARAEKRFDAIAGRCPVLSELALRKP
jgi:RNA polymerase sigma-70 factor (ECF subfamily)